MTGKAEGLLSGGGGTGSLGSGRQQERERVGEEFESGEGSRMEKEGPF